MIMEAIKNLNKPFIDPTPKTLKPSPAVPHNHGSSKGAKPKASTKLFSPRKVEDTMNQFGLNMLRSQNNDEEVSEALIQYLIRVYLFYFLDSFRSCLNLIFKGPIL